jgi:glycosyltransferase involved in cell wall biosynthesis
MGLDPWGGSEELWSNAAGHLLERGCEVVVSKKAWTSVPPVLASLAAAGAKIEYRKELSRTQRVIRKITGPRPYEMSLLEQHVPGFVLISLGNNTEGVEWMEAAMAAQIPYAIVTQSVVPWGWPRDEAAGRLRVGYLRASKAYFVSKENIALTERHLGCDLLNAVLVRNPFKVPYKQAFLWPAPEPARWACVGRLDAFMKGQDLLFDVLANDKWRNRDLQVTLYGKGRNERILREECERRQLCNVQFGGFADPVTIWSKEHCLILPSRAEGLPLAVVEAMLCGRPCIVTDAGGNRELLEDTVTGFISSAPTISALGEAMERAWHKRSEWRGMGELAAVSVRNHVPPDPGRIFADALLALVQTT